MTPIQDRTPQALAIQAVDRGSTAVRLMSSGAIIASLLAMTTPAIAQDARDDGMEEIVVTARQREERIQEVPLDVTAFSGQDIAERGIRDMRDIAALTPGMSFQTGAGSGYTQPVVRGASLTGAASLAQNVSFFLDGIYLPRSYLTNVGVDMLQRVEIVQGPQSARYGRNAFMGAVNYISKPFTDDLAAEFSGTVGNHGNYEATGTMSGALIKDRLRVRGGIDYQKFGGSWKNNAPFCDIDFSPGTDCSVGGYKKVTVNVAAQLLLSDRLKVDFSYHHFYVNSEAQAQNFFAELGGDSEFLNCGQFNANVRPLSAGGVGAGGQWFRLYCGEIPVRNVPQDPRGYAQQLKADIYRASAEWQLTDSLTLSNLYGRIVANNFAFNYKDTATLSFFLPGQAAFENGPIGNNRADSNETRLSFDNHGPLRASVGFFYWSNYDYSTTSFTTLPPLTAIPTATVDLNDVAQFITYGVNGRTITRTKNYSPFGEINYTLLDDKAHIGVEARYTIEKKFQGALATSATSYGLGDFVGNTLNGTFKTFTPRFTVDYRVQPGSMIYAAAARGATTGGFNPRATLPENRSYGPNQNWTYELGVKNSFANGRIVFNANLFLVKWTNIQISAPDTGNPAPLPLPIIRNLGNVTSKGFEVSASVVPIEHMRISGTLYHGDATYDKGTRDLGWARTPAVCDNIVCRTDGDISGNQTPYNSRWQWSLSPEWRSPISATSEIQAFARTDITYQTKQFNEDVNLSWIPARTLVNAAIGLSSPNWDVQIWARNLFDKQYVAGVVEATPNMQYNSYLGDRRTIGLTTKLKY